MNRDEIPSLVLMTGMQVMMVMIIIGIKEVVEILLRIYTILLSSMTDEQHSRWIKFKNMEEWK